MEFLALLLLCIACIVLGAFLDHRFYARAAAALKAERDKLIQDYSELATKAHDERDALFAMLAVRSAAAAAAAASPTEPPPSPAPAPSPSASLGFDSKHT